MTDKDWELEIKMYRNHIKESKLRLRIVVISSLLLLLVFNPLTVFAKSDDSIATLRQMGKAFASIAEKASLAVVGVKSQRTVTREYGQSPFSDPFGDDLYEFFFGPRQRQQQPRRYQVPRTAQGSGFIISADGYILTNNHVVEGADKVEVELTDGRKFTAEIIGTDEDSDVAVIKIDAKDLSYLELADSDTLEVGEWVLAVGNPLGLSHTVTAGIVSAKGRSGFGLATLENFIQTDAAINFGNSGGPLINLDGKVVGINSAIAGSTGNIGIGFAIPINMAKYVYDQLIKSGTVERGLLGVVPQDLKPENAEAFGLENTKGVLIPDIEPGSAADKAGLQYTDVILEIDGVPVESADALRNRIAMMKPETKVELTIWRDGKRQKVEVVLGKRTSTAQADGNASSNTSVDLGFTVANLTDELAQRYGYEDLSGVIVTDIDPGSQARSSGITEGTLIRQVDGKPVRNVREFNQAMETARKRGRVTLRIYTEGYHYFVFLKL
jgi:serine protease Do